MGVRPMACAVGRFFVLDRAAGVGDVGLAGLAEALEAAAGADAVDGDLAGEAFILEALGHALGQREDGRGAGGDDVAAHRCRIDFGQHHAGCWTALRSTTSSQQAPR